MNAKRSNKWKNRKLKILYVYEDERKNVFIISISSWWRKENKRNNKRKWSAHLPMLWCMSKHLFIAGVIAFQWIVLVLMAYISAQSGSNAGAIR